MAKGSNISVHSPADGLADGWNIGGASKGGALSVHPDINVSGNAPSDSPVGAGFGDTDMQTPVSVTEVQLATGVPESYSPDASDGMVGGLGTPPKA